jgi:hypothetical protein
MSHTAGKGLLGFRSQSSYRVHPSVAPPEMFQKDVGATAPQHTQRIGKLLCTRTFQMCEMQDVNRPELSQNVIFLRPEVGGWNKAFPFQPGYDIGSHVKCARSTSTVKRIATIANRDKGTS